MARWAGPLKGRAARKGAMCAQAPVLVRGPVLRRAEHWVVMKAAWVAARLRAPDAVLMISRRGVRLFSANDLAAPAWWLNVTVREPTAAPGHALIAPPAEVWEALRATWGRAGTHVAAGPGAVRFEGRSAATEVHGRAVPFGAGTRGIPAGGNGVLDVNTGYPAAVASVSSTLAADVAAVAARSDTVELRLVRDGRGWWIEAAGDGRVRRLPAEMVLLPSDDVIVGHYPAGVLAELLSFSELADLTVEFVEPVERPAIRVGWEEHARRIRVEAFVAPLV